MGEDALALTCTLSILVIVVSVVCGGVFWFNYSFDREFQKKIKKPRRDFVNKIGAWLIDGNVDVVSADDFISFKVLDKKIEIKDGYDLTLKIDGVEVFIKDHEEHFIDGCIRKRQKAASDEKIASIERLPIDPNEKANSRNCKTGKNKFVAPPRRRT
jgi:hypothetical protein